MKKPKSNLVTIIKHSCTTGRPVWIYQGPTKNAARIAYERARRRENTKIRWWKKHVKQRADHIKTFLERLIAALPIVGEITQEQLQAIRTLKRMAEQPPPCDKEFYNHCQQERRRRRKEREEQRYWSEKRRQWEERLRNEAAEARKKATESAGPSGGKKDLEPRL